ncbi:hypothetical protein T484DRAFT_1840095 [Baffinella frigidus]|nr:hypothetical protein T484DRAFT_1840095 [Cryptophyta sp. CCMP2293]
MQGAGLSSWVPVPEECDFTIHNLPDAEAENQMSVLVVEVAGAVGFVREEGYSQKGCAPRCGVAIGEMVLDLAAVALLW